MRIQIDERSECSWRTAPVLDPIIPEKGQSVTYRACAKAGNGWSWSFFFGSLCREGSFQKACVGGTQVAGSVLLARFGEETVFGICELVGAKSQSFGSSLRRDGIVEETCVGGSQAPVFYCLALASRHFSEGLGW